MSSAVTQYDTLKEFLSADIHVPFHSTYVSEAETTLQLNYDIDRLVIEFINACGLLADFHYLQLPDLRPALLKDCWHYVKKHFDLTRCSSDGLRSLKNCLGHQTAQVDGGYHLNLTFLPTSVVCPDQILLDKEGYRHNAREMYRHIVAEFRRQLINASPQDRCRPTLQKQNSRNTENYNVLKQDLRYILSLLDIALRASDISFLKPVLFLNKFGQKDARSFDLFSVANPLEVSSVSAHVAVKITAVDPEIHLLFARYGLQELVGYSGCIYTVLGIHEATNFQTDLDRRKINAERRLLNVFENEGWLNFFQLYVDSPHVHIKVPFKHPVTGALVTSGLSHPQFQWALLDRAVSYVFHMKDLKEKLVGQLGLRIEQVRRFEDPGDLEIVPKVLFCEEALFDLFQDNAIVLPFKDTDVPSGLLPTLTNIIKSLVEELVELFDEYQGVAQFDSVWRCFQVELALEEMFFGHPLALGDYHLSVSLGTSTVNPNSLTNTRGFIGFSPHNAASAGEVPPPLEHWTRDETLRNRLECIFPVCQVLEAVPALAGTAVIRLLLCDIFRRNDAIP